MKKANISINEMIIAALVVVVILVVGYIWIQYSSSTNIKIKSCVLRGGQCVKERAGCAGTIVIAECQPEKPFCCETI